MKRILTGLVVLGLLVLASPSFAAPPCGVCKAAESDSYFQKLGGQLTRGVANTALGWTELINQPVKESHAGGNILVGVFNGFGQGLLRTAKGVGEILTSPLPRVEGQYPKLAEDCPLGIMGMTDR